MTTKHITKAKVPSQISTEMHTISKIYLSSSWAICCQNFVKSCLCKASLPITRLFCKWMMKSQAVAESVNIACSSLCFKWFRAVHLEKKYRIIWILVQWNNFAHYNSDIILIVVLESPIMKRIRTLLSQFEILVNQGQHEIYCKDIE